MHEVEKISGQKKANAWVRCVGVCHRFDLHWMAASKNKKAIGY
jgi:hypothetical protein